MVLRLLKVLAKLGPYSMRAHKFLQRLQYLDRMLTSEILIFHSSPKVICTLRKFGRARMLASDHIYYPVIEWRAGGHWMVSVAILDVGQLRRKSEKMYGKLFNFERR